MQLKPSSTFWKVIAGVLASIAGFFIITNKRNEKKLVKAQAASLKAEAKEVEAKHEKHVKSLTGNQLADTIDERFGSGSDTDN